MSNVLNKDLKKEIDHVIDILKSIQIGNDLEMARQGLDNLGTPIAEDIEVKKLKINDIDCQFITPPKVNINKVILYLHGGGYFCGSLISHGGLASEMARASNCCALQIQYRKAPEHKFPAPIDDSCNAYLWLLAQGFKPENIVLAGDSAGGGLVIATMLALKDRKIPQPAGGVCLSPWVDMAATGESHITRKDADPIVKMDTVHLVINLYMNGVDIKTPLASPIHGNLMGLPPLLIHVGEREILFSDAQMLAETAKKYGVRVVFEEWPEMVHVWHMFYKQLTEARLALTKIGTFVQETTAG